MMREKYLVVLEVDIPKAGEPVDAYASTQNAPDKWNWTMIHNHGDEATGKRTDIKLVSSTKTKEYDVEVP